MQTWEELRETCLSCEQCALCQTRTHVVFGDGNPKAGILFIGEAPGEQEDLSGKPFVGRGGQLLDDMLSLIDLQRDKHFFIANMVKCRPPANRDPSPQEQAACMGHLQAQIAILQPKIMVCLGRIAAQKLLGKQFKITQDHGKWFEVDGRPTMALYHPAFLLRDPRKKPETFVDLKTLQAKIQACCPEIYQELEQHSHE